MKKSLFGTATAALLFAASLANAQVVINEFVYDDSSTDDEEFIELYNTTGSAVDISGYTIELVNGADGAVYSTITIPAATSLAANDHYLIKFSSTVGGPAADFTAPVASIQNDTEGIRLKNAGATIIDAVGYETRTGFGSLPADAYEGQGIQGALSGSTGIDRTAVRQVLSASRFQDGLDTGNNAADFGIIGSTPGASNNTPAFVVTLPYTNQFNVAPATAFGEFWGRFVDPESFDPTAALAGQAAVGASLDGGNAGVFSDYSGGGDSYNFAVTPTADLQFEAYVWINGTTYTVATEYAAWGISLGSVGEGYNPTSSAGGFINGFGVRYGNNISADSAGTVGSNTNSLQFLEKYGSTETVLGTVTVTAGVNDGWQRILLRRQGTTLTAIYGGNLKTDNTGTIFTGTGVSKPTGVSIGFREAAALNTWLYMDAVSIGAPGVSNVNEWSLY